MRLRALYGEYEGAQASRGDWTPLLARPVRQVLNMVAVDMVKWMSKEDREDIDGWLTCTVQEAIDFQAQGAAEDLARQKRLLNSTGVEVT